MLPSGEFIVGDLIMRGMIRFWQPNYPLKDFNGGLEIR
jgi:hypothetical protein